MPKAKIITSLCIFSVLLGFTSVIKTQTRIFEKQISKIDRKISFIKKDLHETQLDYSYLSSPGHLAKKIVELANIHSKGRVISFFEGGYDIQALSESVKEHLKALKK